MSAAVSVTFLAPLVDAPAVKVTVAVVPGEIDAGLTVAVTPAGALSVSATAVFPLPLSLTLTVNVVDLPGSTVPPLPEAVNTKSVFGAGAPAPQLLTSSAPSTDPRPVARL